MFKLFSASFSVNNDHLSPLKSELFDKVSHQKINDYKIDKVKELIINIYKLSKVYNQT